MTDTKPNKLGTYLADDGRGPEIWRTRGSGQDHCVLSRENLRIALWREAGYPYGDAYRADAEAIWSVVVAAVERGDL